MITPEMRASGWRECPPDPARRDWDAKGGRWQSWYVRSGSTPVVVVDPEGHRSALWRPVHPSTWDYDCRGWGVAVPTESGYWWRKTRRNPVKVEPFAFLSGSLGWWEEDREHFSVVTDDGQWLAPCVKPEAP